MPGPGVCGTRRGSWHCRSAADHDSDGPGVAALKNLNSWGNNDQGRVGGIGGGLQADACSAAASSSVIVCISSSANFFDTERSL
jgi:hypothetical protein